MLKKSSTFANTLLAGTMTLTGSLLLTSATKAQEPSFSVGPATEINSGLFDCGPRARISAVGKIAAEDGTEWIVPAQTHFETATKATDLYNECNGNTMAGIEALDLTEVPLLDAGGDEEFVAYIFADNYFELYANGKLLAIDAVPFTPFNSSVVRFKASRPLTLAVMLVDWEENLGLGSEQNRRSAFHAGDGGLVAHIQDIDGKTVALTDNSWRAQTFYTAPLKQRACLKIDGALRDSSACDTSGTDDGTGFSAAHWPIPENWMMPEYDDNTWPMASTFTNKTVGVDNKKAYTNFTSVFDATDEDAEFIWSSNLILDNLVLVRKVIK